MNWCPNCGSVLIWGDNTSKTQDCYCMNCGKKYVAIFEERKFIKKEKKRKND